MNRTWTNDHGDIPWWYWGPAFRGVSRHTSRGTRLLASALLGLALGSGIR